jgi:hypothetical protein
MKRKKSKKHVYEATLASVVKEMAVPRIAESVRKEEEKAKGAKKPDPSAGDSFRYAHLK